MIITFPNSPFKLHQAFEPAGDQPVAIARLVEGIDDGLAFQTLLGVTGSGKTYTIANMIARLGRPAIMMAPNKTLAAQLYAEMRQFPNETSIARLREVGVTYIVVHHDLYSPEEWALVEPRLAQSAGLQLVHDESDGRVYSVLPD